MILIIAGDFFEFLFNKKYSLETEVWKNVVGYEGLYQVSNLGRFKRLCPRNAKGQLIGFGCRNNIGYMRVSLSKGGFKDRVLLHRVVAMAFIPNPEGKDCINHLNGIKHDNRIENLEWCTRAENNRHAFKMGLINSDHLKGKLGENNSSAKKIVQKNTDDSVVRIWGSTADAARALKTHKSCIWKCLSGLRPFHLKFKWEYYEPTETK